MRQIGFRDLDSVFSGKRTVLHMPGGDYQTGETFLATAVGKRTGRVCEIIDARKVRLRDDMTPRTLDALGCTLEEYRSRWNAIHRSHPFNGNPEVCRVEFQCTDREERRGLTLCEEEDIAVFEQIDAAVKAIEVECKKPLTKSPRKLLKGKPRRARS